MSESMGSINSNASTKKLRVALIFGGKSSEHEVSVASATSIYNALDKSRYEVTLIGIDRSGRWVLTAVQDLLAAKKNPMMFDLDHQSETVSLVPYESNSPLISMKQSSLTPIPEGGFDVLFSIVHGTQGEDGCLQGLCELSQMAYVGSGVLGSAIGMDKDVARRLLMAAGIPVVPTLVVKNSEFKRNFSAIAEKVKKEFSLPVFVKPANAGSSVGVAKVKEWDQLEQAMREAFAFDTKILIEKAVAARELEVAILGNESPRASIVGEIVPTHEFYSYEAKYLDENGAHLKIPADNLSQELTQQIQKLAIEAFQVLECAGLARVDFFLDRKTNELFLNEINTLPGFTKISMYPKLWEASGVGYSQLLDELIRLALERRVQRANLVTEKDPGSK